MQPLGYRLHPAVFDRIEMNVIEMPRVIVVVANRMLPEAALPDAPFATARSYPGSLLRTWDRLHEADLDRLPSVGEILNPGRQCLHAVQVVGQHHPGVDVKGPLLAGQSYGFAQCVDVANQEVRASLQQIHGEEVGASGHAIPAIVRHLGSCNPFGLLCVGWSLKINRWNPLHGAALRSLGWEFDFPPGLP